MKCQHCQQQHPTYYTYCPETGTTVDDTLNQRFTYKTVEFCVSCGQQNKEGYSSCSNCGNSLLKTEEQKLGLNQFLNPILPESPISGEMLSKHLNKEQLKNVSKENLKYIKHNRFILAPILISIVLMLLFGFMMKSTMFNIVQDMVFEGADEESLMFLKDNLFEKELYEQFGVNVDVPSFPYVTMFITLAHNASYEFSLSVQDFYGDPELFNGQLVHGSYGLMIVALLILSIGAVIYGVMAKKKNWPFWRGIVYSAVLYTIFIGIVTLFARYQLNVNVAGEIGIEGSLKPSIIRTMFSSLLLVGTVFSVVGYIAYNGKKSVEQLNRTSKYFQYAVYSIAVTVVGLVIHLLNMFIVIDKLKNKANSYLFDIFDTEFITNSALSSVIALYYSVVNWNLSLFGKLNVFISGDGYSEQYDYKWFMDSNVDELGLVSNILKDETLLFPPFVFILLVVLCIGFAGYLLYSRHKLDFKEVAIFAGIFTVIQLVIIYCTSITFEMNSGYELMKYKMSYSFLNTLLGSFILAYISFYAGGYVKGHLRRVKQ